MSVTVVMAEAKSEKPEAGLGLTRADLWRLLDTLSMTMTYDTAVSSRPPLTMRCARCAQLNNLLVVLLCDV